MTQLGEKTQPAAVRTSRLPAPLALVRPGQWPKNLLVVPLPLLGAGWQPDTGLRVALATAAFVLASSLVYVLNDIADVERDKRHPVKRHRPLASGRMSMGSAVTTALVLTGLLVPALAVLGTGTAAVVLLYLAVNGAYSFKLKHLPLLDVFVVATGFVLRLLGGYQAGGRAVEVWLVLTVLVVCLVLILGKRRHELGVSGTGHRPALVGYSAHFLDLVLVLCSALTMIGYLMYLRTESGFGDHALLTVPCALFALFRYLQVVVVDGGGGEPVRTLLRDRTMLANSSVWAALLLVPVLV
ncbi:UbiA prenyltransferase family protein [Streptomyces sp. C10-9-1]|uniref:UbiA prenyltransferase family protein n=1 Tax=Streptomyces sp. C10-9-1 TaxID=1859285 RepID=UPI0021114136|nr:UbiA prenyltransferase family protein [Streptomyces sp. C10-9-1]MCQ6554353.1 UbiA prenyltransferase family protein [Streptomyces sp. C10-9-1]